MSRALVLGGGGVAGIGWEAGLIVGLRDRGVHLDQADLIVGTSAGSVVGAMVAQGADLKAAIAQVAVDEAEAVPTKVDFGKVIQAFAFMYDEQLHPAEARRKVGELALGQTDDDGRLLKIADHLPSPDWPEQRLLITAVDAQDGSFQIWDAAGGVSLALAVTSSCCVPCVFPPVEINGRRYIDGGVRSISNADLAAGADRVVIIEPMAHFTPRSVLAREIERLGEAKVVALGPDHASVKAFGTDVLDSSVWLPAFEAGLEQAPAVAEQVRQVWE